MYRSVLITGVTAAAIVGAGTTALATTGSDTTSGTPTNTSSTTDQANKAGQAGKNKLLRRALHAQIVTKGKNGFVTHDFIKGTVTSVSATSITVEAADKRSDTFTIAKDTTVRARANGKATASTIGKVAKGDRVLVAGTGTTTLTAKHVVDLGRK
jgi:preprotein translocase subunit YajC